MEIKNMMLVAEGEDPTAAEPVIVHCDSEGSCLLITIEKGERKANIFLWRDSDGRVWRRMTTAGDNQKGDLGKEINLFEEDDVQPQGAVNAPIVEEQPGPNEENGTEGESETMPEDETISKEEITPEEEGVPDGVEIPF